MKFSFSYIFILVFSITVILSSFTCSEPCYKTPKFDIPISLSPVFSTYHLGDTIQINIRISTDLEDQNTSDTITVGQYDFEIGFALHQFTESELDDAINDFNYYFEKGDHIISVGTFSQSRLFFDTSEQSDFQEVIFGVIVGSRKGDFGIYFGSNKDGLTGTKYFPEDDCDYVFELSFITNGGTTENVQTYLDKYPAIPDYFGIDFTAEKFNMLGAYFFTVD